MELLDKFYAYQAEPCKACLLAIRDIIMQEDPEVITLLKYGIPFFTYRGKPFAYLWFRKDLNQPYLGLLYSNVRGDHESLQADRPRVNIMCFDPNTELPVEILQTTIRQIINFRKETVL